ncbi:MAG: hypothetical protein U0R50_15615 [Gaiellales bacterium]
MSIREGFTTAERRAFQQLATADGRLAVVALDQRQSLVAAREKAGLTTDAAALLSLKRDIVCALGAGASGFLLDPEIALPALVDEGVVQRDTGLLVAIERSGTTDNDGVRITELLPDVGAAGVRRLGGTAAKLLVYVRPDRESPDGPNGRLIREATQACANAHLLLVVEILTYRAVDEDADGYARAKPRLIHEAALFAAACGARFLKLESPGSEAECSSLTDALSVPWAVLSAGVDHETFVGTLRGALAGGASGFIAGRSLWKEAVVLGQPERKAFLAGEGKRRLEELLALLG